MIRSLFERSVFLTTLVGTTAYIAASGDLSLGLVVIPLFILGWLITSRTGGKRLPRAVVLMLTGLATAVASLAMFADEQFSVETLARFVAILIVVKSFDRASPRDHAQLIALALFLVLGAMVTSVQLIPGVLALLFLPLLLGSVLLYHIDAGRAILGDTAAAIPPRGFLRDLSVLGSVTGLIAILISAFVFVVVPRGIGDAIAGGVSGPGVGSITGFTPELNLTAGGTIETDPEIVLEVQPEETQGAINAVAPPILYLRGAVLDVYRDGRWRASDPRPGQRVSERMVADVWFAPRGRLPSGTERYRISIRNASAGVSPLFVPDRTIGLRLSVQGQVSWRRDLGIYKRDGDSGRLVYDVLVAQPTSSLALPERSPVELFENEIIQALAERVLRDAGIEPDPALRPVERDLEAARVLRSHLSRTHEYSLTRPEIPFDADPIEYFLDNELAGHCEFFASSLVALCRTVGISARGVAGYVAAEVNPTTGGYVVRRSNAHAWAEIERSPGEWVLLDPTPTTDLREIHQPETSVLRRARQFLEVLEQAWVNSIVAFDSNRRERLLGLQQSSDPTGLLGIARFLEQLEDLIEEGGAAALGAGLLAAGLTTGFGFGLLWIYTRLRRPRAIHEQWQRWPSEAMRGAHIEILSAFRRLDDPKPDGRSLLKHAELVGNAPLLHASQVLCRHRFQGGHPESELSDAMQAVSRVGRDHDRT